MTEGSDDATSGLPGVLQRIAAVRSWASSPLRRRIVYLAAVALFLGTTAIAWVSLPDDRAAIEILPLLVSAVLVIPGAFVNAEEYRVSARILGQKVPLGTAMRVATVAAAFNLLPIPGSVLVRTNALVRSGSTTAKAVSSTLAVGLAYIGVALVLVGAVQAPAAPGAGVVVAVAGVGAVIGGAVMVRRLVDGPVGSLLRDLVVVEVASVGFKAARLFLVVAALGFDVSFAQSASLSLATVGASAVGIFPGGLGIRELFAGLISPAVGLPASVGLVATSVDRVVGLTALSVLSPIVLWLTRDSDRAEPVER